MPDGEEGAAHTVRFMPNVITFAEPSTFSTPRGLMDCDDDAYYGADNTLLEGRRLRRKKKRDRIIAKAERGVKVFEQLQQKMAKPLGPATPACSAANMFRGTMSFDSTYRMDFSASLSLDNYHSLEEGSEEPEEVHEPVEKAQSQEVEEMLDMDVGLEDDKLADDDEDEDRGNFRTTKPVRLNSIYLLERCLWCFQASAIMLTIPIEWPQSFLSYARVILYTLDFGTQWLHYLSLKLYLDVVLTYWDLIHFGMTAILPILVLLLLFHFWVIPDYTEALYTRRWIDKYVFHWWSFPCGGFIKSFLMYLVGMALAAGATYLAKMVVGNGVDTMVGVAGGGLITALWLVFMFSCFLLRR